MKAKVINLTNRVKAKVVAKDSKYLKEGSIVELQEDLAKEFEKRGIVKIEK